MKKTFLIILCQWLLTAACVAQPVPQSWKLLDAGIGLSDNQIRGISQTEDGQMVIKTAEQVNVYNGATVQQYPYDKHHRYHWDYDRQSKEYHDSNGRIWLKGLGHLQLLDLRTGEYVTDIEGVLAAMGVRCRIKDLYIDDQKNFWLVTEQDDILTYDIGKQELRTVFDGHNEAKIRYGNLWETARYKNFCWLFFDSGYLICLDYVSGEIIAEEKHFVAHPGSRVAMQSDATGNLWVALGADINYYHRLERTWTTVYTISGNDNFCTCMDIDRNGTIWVGTSKGGIVAIHSDHTVAAIPDFEIPGYGLLHNDIHDVYCDHDGGIWVGTLFMGICYYHPIMGCFQYGTTSTSRTLVTSENVRCFLPCSDGSVLVGSSLGLFRFHPRTQEMDCLFRTEENDIVISLYRDTYGRVWAGTFTNGFYLVEEKGVVRSQKHAIPDVNVGRAMYEDKQHRLWISTNAGVALYNPQTMSVEHLLTDTHPDLARYKVIQALYPDGDGQGFTTIGLSGIFHYDIQTDSVSIPLWAVQLGVQNDNIRSIMRDSRNLLWLGTCEGIIVYDLTHAQELARLSTEDGLNNSNIAALIEGAEHDIWASSENGVNCIKVTGDDGGYNFRIHPYGRGDGLQSGRFYENALCRTPEGMLYFGGVNGFNYIDAADTKVTITPRVPIFTSLQISGQQVGRQATDDGHSVYFGNISYTKKLTLCHHQNSFTLSFAPLNYFDSNTRYRYRLYGNDKNWTDGQATGLGQITYTGLQPGNYRLEVYCQNVAQQWSPRPAIMEIKVLPPWWATWWARIIYLLLTTVVIYCTYQVWKRRRHIQRIRKNEIIKHRQQEEFNQMKFRFFTNVSHEFRTPLTLIITPLEAILHRTEDEVLRRQLKPIHTNAQRLLQLVNQLLDFRKLEMGGEHLDLKNGEIVRFVKELCHGFKDTAAERCLELSFDSDTEQLYMAFDNDKVYKIVGNLLSNAFKYTADGGKVRVMLSVDADKQRVAIQVSDTGQGISADELPLIWERFYQTGGQEKSPSIKGSGIGLHIVKEYTGMHQGEVTVTSQPGRGTTFTVTLPTTLQAAQAASEEQHEGELHEAAAEDGKTRILIVDDNSEFRHFMTSQLAGEGYAIVEASDGIEAEEMAVKSNPDMVITDLMMPRRDGVELTQTLKRNIELSHIPVILLTAKAGDEAKIEAYRAGADDYIAKPFNYELLLLRIQRLMEQKQQRRQQFRNDIDISPSQITVTSLDEGLIRKAVEAIERNITDGEFGVEQLGSEIGLSKTHLNRKLQAIVGMTPLQFIRSVRLKRAAQLLRDSQYNVSEIAYMAGFNTLKYFNKHFREEFNMSPTQYREEHGTK